MKKTLATSLFATAVTVAVLSTLVIQSARATRPSRPNFSNLKDGGELFPQKEIEAMGFEVLRTRINDHPDDEELSWTAGLDAIAESRHLRLSAGTMTYVVQRPPTASDQWMYAARASVTRTDLESRAPLGRQLIFRATTNRAGVTIDGPLERLSASVCDDPGISPKGEPVEHSIDYKEFEPFLEFVARTLLGRSVGRRLFAREPVTLRDKSVRSFVCGLSDRRFIDLADWSQARGFGIGSPDTLPSITASGNGHEVYFPLGAMKVRVDGEWRDLPDCVAEKDGRWLVPVEIDNLVP